MMVDKCCMERMFAEFHVIKDKNQLLNAVRPCKKGTTNETVLLNEVFRFYFNQSVPDQHKICSEYYCEEPVKATYKVCIALLMLILIFIIVGNTFVITVARYVRKFRENVTSLFVVSLAFSDLFANCIGIPILIMFASHNGYFCYNVYVCKLYIIAETTCFTASFIQLLVISLDRYVAVFYPYFYRSHFTSKRAKIAIFFVWLNAILWGVLKEFDFEEMEFGAIQIKYFQFQATSRSHTIIFTCVIFFIPVIIMCVLYFQIWLIAIAQAKQLEHQKVQVEYNRENHQNIENNKTTAIHHHKVGFFHRRKSELRATRVILTILGTFIICWSPNLIMSFVDAFQEIKIDTIVYIFVYQIPPGLSSALNPFIYCILHKDFRKSLKLTTKRIQDGFAHRFSIRRKKKERKTKNCAKPTTLCFSYQNESHL